MKKSFFFKILFIFILITTVFFALILFISFRFIRNHYNITLSQNLVQFANTFHSHLEIGDIDDPAYLNRIEVSNGFSNDFRVSIINTNREIVNSTRESLIGNRVYGNIGVSALNLEQSLQIPYQKDERIYYILTLFTNNDTKYYARYSIDTLGITDRLNKLVFQIIKISIVIFIIMIIALWLVSSLFSGRMNSLIEAAAEVAQGNFDVRLHFETKDELRMLADSFNDMTSQIKFLFDELNSEKQELKTLMESMHEALCVIDEHDKVVYANETFHQLVSQRVVFDRSYWEFLRDSHIDDLIKKIRMEKKKIIEEINIYNKIYLISGQFFPNRKQTILLFSDISEIKSAEAIKKNLVSSVSHELRTPLTSIKGFVETLKIDEEDSERIKYLEIIERNTYRLENIVKDLLELSSLEDNEVNLTYETINLQNLVNNVAMLFDEKLKQKELDLLIKISADMNLEADYFKMEQVLINLIDNAVKYTEQGSITVSAYKKNSTIMLEITDTGYGIPSRYLTRIFDRFYVVDKSRSRQQGGTGLGLSIVKNIVKLHHGEINVQSALGKGTTFQIIIPV